MARSLFRIVNQSSGDVIGASGIRIPFMVNSLTTNLPLFLRSFTATHINNLIISEPNAVRIEIDVTDADFESGSGHNLSLQYEGSGYIGLFSDTKEARIFTGGRDFTEPYEYVFTERDHKAEYDAVKGVIDSLGVNSVFYLAVAEEPILMPMIARPVFTNGAVKADFTPKLAPPPPPPVQEFWEQRLNEELQKLPTNFGMPSLVGRIYPDVYIKDYDNEEDSERVPHIVYSEIGFDSIDGFDGSFRSSVNISLDFRSPDRNQAALMARIAIGRLRSTGFITSINAKNTLHDLETELFRNIVDVSLTTSEPPRRLPPSGDRRFTFQFSKEFF